MALIWNAYENIEGEGLVTEQITWWGWKAYHMIDTRDPKVIWY